MLFILILCLFNVAKCDSGIAYTQTGTNNDKIVVKDYQKFAEKYDRLVEMCEKFVAGYKELIEEYLNLPTNEYFDYLIVMSDPVYFRLKLQQDGQVAVRRLERGNPEGLIPYCKYGKLYYHVMNPEL